MEVTFLSFGSGKSLKVDGQSHIVRWLSVEGWVESAKLLIKLGAVGWVVENLGSATDRDGN